MIHWCCLFDPFLCLLWESLPTTAATAMVLEGLTLIGNQHDNKDRPISMRISSSFILLLVLFYLFCHIFITSQESIDFVQFFGGPFIALSAALLPSFCCCWWCPWKMSFLCSSLLFLSIVSFSVYFKCFCRIWRSISMLQCLEKRRKRELVRRDHLAMK